MLESDLIYSCVQTRNPGLTFPVFLKPFKSQHSPESSVTIREGLGQGNKYVGGDPASWSCGSTARAQDQDESSQARVQSQLHH